MVLNRDDIVKFPELVPLMSEMWANQDRLMCL